MSTAVTSMKATMMEFRKPRGRSPSLSTVAYASNEIWRGRMAIGSWR